MFKGTGLNSGCFKGYSIDEAIPLINKAGFKNIELASMFGWCEHINPFMSEDEIGRIKNLLEDNSLNVSSIAANVDFLSSEEAETWVCGCINIAPKFGAETVVISPGEGDETARIRAFKKFDALCGDNNIKLAIEPVGSLYCGKMIIDQLKKADTKNSGINIDTANGLFFAGYNPMADIAESSAYIVSAHIKDKRGGKGIWDFPAPGEGELPIKELCAVLHKAGYTGLLNVEIEFTEKGSLSLDNIIRSLDIAQNTMSNIISQEEGK